jgi:hypothetical protein
MVEVRIKVSTNQAHYVKLGFKKDADDSPTGTHQFVGELPPYDSAKKGFPTVGLVTRMNEFVALPLLSHFVSSVLYTGIRGKELRFVKGSFLKSVSRVKQEKWKPTVDHSDFDHEVQAEGKAQPIMFIICLKGETPLDFGSFAKSTFNVRSRHVFPSFTKEAIGDLLFGVIFCRTTGRVNALHQFTISCN